VTDQHQFVVCCDLDGVIWRGDEAIPGAADGIAALRAAGAHVAFLTNNSSGRVSDYVEKLTRMGIEARGVDVATSAQAAAALLHEELPRGSTVLACAGPGVVEALERNAFFVVDEGPADAVVVGWHHEFNFDRLARASDAVRAGARYIATNLDPTYPSATGVLPGAGAIAAAVTTAAGVQPVVAGKPNPPTVALVKSRFGRRGVMVGDRPSTDGALADALGWPFALVMSGVCGSKGGEPVPDPPPPYVAADFCALAPMLLDAIG
jgi:HAD superfamily hydrolase (TIGR01450 family)